MAKCELRVPPKSPEIDDIWEREDGVQFLWTGTEDGWMRLHKEGMY